MFFPTHNKGPKIIKLIIVAALAFSSINYASGPLILSQEAAKELFDKGRPTGADVDLNNNYNYTSKIKDIVCRKKVKGSVDQFDVDNTTIEVITESSEEDSSTSYKCYLISE